LATLTANNVLLGNGTSALQAVAPGTAGNVLISNGTTWTSAAAPASGGSIDATASGALTAGAPAIINSNGTVSAVSGSFSSYTAGSEVNFFGSSSNQNADVSIQYDAASGRFFAGMSRSPTGNNPAVAVGTISGNTITWGTFYSPASGTGSQPQILYKAGYVYFFWVNSGGAGLYATYQWTAGTNILTPVTAQTDIDSAAGQSISRLCSTNVPIGDNRFVLAYRNDSNSGYGVATLCNANSGTVTFSGTTNFNPAGTSNISIATISDDGGYGRSIISFTDEGNSNRPTSVVGTVAFGFAYIIGPKAEVGSSFGATFTSTLALGGSTFCASGRNTSSGAGYGVIGTVSNSFYSATITFGSLVNFTASANENYLTYDSANSRIIVTFNNSANNLFSFNVGTFSGTTLTWGTQQTIQAAAGNNQTSYINPANGNVMAVYEDGNNSGYTTQLPLIPTFSTNLTTINFLGVSAASYSNGQTATIKVIGGVDSNQSGLTAGLKYYVRANGTLTASEGFAITYGGLALSATKLLVKG
jgi:hypothetical protein